MVNGLPSMRVRAEESERLMEWGFREFDMVRLFRAGEAVETAAVWMGNPDRVPLVPAEDVAASLRRGAREQMRVSVRVEEPVPAPIRQGDRVGTLVLQVPDMPVREVPLVAGAEVEEKGFLGRVAGAAGHLLFGGL